MTQDIRPKIMLPFKFLSSSTTAQNMKLHHVSRKMKEIRKKKKGSRKMKEVKPRKRRGNITF